MANKQICDSLTKEYHEFRDDCKNNGVDCHEMDNIAFELTKNKCSFKPATPKVYKYTKASSKPSFKLTKESQSKMITYGGLLVGGYILGKVF